MVNRKKSPQETIDNILIDSARRCCLCFGLNHDYSVKDGQIAHLDHNPANSLFDNLAYFCLDHHNKYDSKTSQSKGYTITEVKAYRNRLYVEVAKRKTHIESIDSNPIVIPEQYFQAGRRVQSVRNELKLKVSQFIEIINFPSENEFFEIEAERAECSSQLLENIHASTGVSLEWLKHGEEKRYMIEPYDFHPVEKAIKQLADLSPTEILITIETRILHVGILTQLNQHHYEILDPGLTLAFWNWEEHLWEISRFYHFLEAMDHFFFPDFEGRIIPVQQDKQLYEGQIHPLVALRHGKPLGMRWPEDILDYRHQRYDEKYYRNIYGIWLLRVQEWIQQRFDYEAKSPKKAN